MKSCVAGLGMRWPRVKPHVCLVAPQAHPLLACRDDVQLVGGAELQQVILARELVARGYRVSMVGLDLGQPDAVEIDGITVFRSFKPSAGIPVIRFLAPRLTGIWRGLVRADADIYYQRAAGMLTGVVSEYCRRYGKKSIFAAAGNPDFERPTPRVRLARDRWIYGYGLQRVDRILVQNLEQARLCLENWGRQSDLVLNILPSLPGLSLQPGQTVLWVSTIRALKRPDLFLELAGRLPQLSFTMVGGPDEDERSLFDRVSARARAMSNVTFKGFIPYSRVGEEFDRAAVLVNTSESEGFPNAFLQAWARGIPTVSFVDAGARMNGRPVGDVVSSLAQMASVVAAWVSNSEDRAVEGQRLRQYASEMHSADSVIGQYEHIFAELICSTAQ